MRGWGCQGSDPPGSFLADGPEVCSCALTYLFSPLHITPTSDALCLVTLNTKSFEPRFKCASLSLCPLSPTHSAPSPAGTSQHSSPGAPQLSFSLSVESSLPASGKHPMLGSVPATCCVCESPQCPSTSHSAWCILGPKMFADCI